MNYSHVTDTTLRQELRRLAKLQWLDDAPAELGPSSTFYSENRADGWPSASYLIKHFGSKNKWSTVLTRFGMRSSTRGDGRVWKRRKPLRVTWEDVQSRIQANMMELPLMAEPKLRPVREWQPRSQTYEVVGYQVVHELR